jgi:translation initiation factor 2 subunit 3
MMPTSEPLQKHHNDSDSESDSDEEGEIEDTIPKIIDVDATKLTPLSPEVISKQVKMICVLSPIS